VRACVRACVLLFLFLGYLPSTFPFPFSIFLPLSFNLLHPLFFPFSFSLPFSLNLFLYLPLSFPLSLPLPFTSHLFSPSPFPSFFPSLPLPLPLSLLPSFFPCPRPYIQYLRCHISVTVPDRCMVWTFYSKALVTNQMVSLLTMFIV